MPTMMTTPTETETVEAYRVAMFEELGFAKEEAGQLAEAHYTVMVKDAKGVEHPATQRVDHHYVRHMLDGGATREQVLQIVT